MKKLLNEHGHVDLKENGSLKFTRNHPKDDQGKNEKICDNCGFYFYTSNKGNCPECNGNQWEYRN